MATANPSPSFFARIGLAFSLFFRVLFNELFSGLLKKLTEGEAVP